MSQLERYVDGGVPVPYGERKPVRRATDIRNEVREKAFEADGAMALSAHIMEGYSDLDAHRKNLAKDDPALDMALSELQGTAFQQVRGIQQSYRKGWRL